MMGSSVAGLRELFDPDLRLPAMRVKCPSCSARLNAKPDVAGERVPCPKCGSRVLVPKLEEFDDDELENSSVAGARKLVYLQKNEVTNSDIAGAFSLLLAVLALAALGAGWFTHGRTYYGSLGLALVGFGLGFLSRGKLRVADCALNFVILLPAVVVSALLLAGVPVVRKAPASPVPADDRPPVEIAKAEDAPPPKHQEPKWIDASKKLPVQVGNVLVQIDEVRIGVSKSIDLNKALEGLADINKAVDSDILRTPIEGANTGVTNERPAVLIQVRVGNPSETKKLELKPWSKTSKGDALRLTDNFKNNYKPLSSSTALLSLGGSSGGTESIKPDTSIVDTLAFEDPIEKTQYLRLELPAENFGGQGTIYFQIPRSMIQGMRQVSK
jgi:DNA-directed RNA polymerase subunit RPC12/RpoP